jgi:hypothetical protein
VIVHQAPEVRIDHRTRRAFGRAGEERLSEIGVESGGRHAAALDQEEVGGLAPGVRMAARCEEQDRPAFDPDGVLRRQRRRQHGDGLGCGRRAGPGQAEREG